MNALKSTYGTILIKPDAHKDVLVGMIIQDLENAGLSTVFRKNKMLSRELAENIYAEHRNMEHYEASVRSIGGKGVEQPVTVLILKSTNDNALKLANKLKGRSDEGGIRLKYRRFSRKDLEGMGFSGENLAFELAKNRLHVPDSDERSLELTNLMLTQQEQEDLEFREPELYNELTNWQRENRKGKLILENKDPGQIIKIR